MTALMLQTLLLTVPAFFIGAALACGLRKLLSPAHRVAVTMPRTEATAVEPMPQYAQREMPRAIPVEKPVAVPPAQTVAGTAGPSRFDDALKGRPLEPPRPAPTPVAAPVQARPQPAPPPPAAPSVERPAASGAGLSRGGDIAAGAAAAAAAVTALAAQAITAVPVPKAPETPIAAPTPESAPPPTNVVVPLARDTVVPTRRFDDGGDDLTRISAIDGGLAAQLEKLGITKYNQVANWRKADVEEISKALGFQGRIERENWIEQAQILTTGSETHYSSQRAKVATAMATAPDVRAAQSAAAPAEAAEAKAPPVRIPLPPVEARASLAPSPTAPAAPTHAEPKAVATPAMPAVAATVAAAAAAAAAAVTAPLAAAVKPVSDTPAVSTSPLPPPAAAAPELPAAEAVRPTMAPSRDALQRIASINAEVETLLGGQGVTRYNQIASWDAPAVDRFDRLLGSPGRIGRENWVEQAQVLAKGGDTAYSRDYDRRTAAVPREPAARPLNIADAIRDKATGGGATDTASRAPISGLRSVRSDAYRAPASNSDLAAAANEVSSQGGAKVVRSAEADDLKRIRGVGVLIEKRLNSIGVVSYAQVADWTTEDIDRVSATLDFKGRIERENWVEQARILSAGGQTEFSRRLDRGEVETPKAR